MGDMWHEGVHAINGDVQMTIPLINSPLLPCCLFAITKYLTHTKFTILSELPTSLSLSKRKNNTHLLEHSENATFPSSNLGFLLPFFFAFLSYFNEDACTWPGFECRGCGREAACCSKPIFEKLVRCSEELIVDSGLLRCLALFCFLFFIFVFYNCSRQRSPLFFCILALGAVS